MMRNILVFLLWVASVSPGHALTDRRFAFPGSSMPVRAIAVDGDTTYFAGYAAPEAIDFAGDVPIRGIGAFDGWNWNSLGGGIRGYGVIRSLVVNAGILYAAGTFTNIGGVSCHGLASWDGSRWSEVPGLEGSDEIFQAQIINEEFWVCGRLGVRDDSRRFAVAHRTGRGWDFLSSELADDASSARRLIVSSTNLLLTGDFTSIHGTPASFLARWENGQWSAFPNNLLQPGDDMIWFRKNLYVASRKIHVWNGSTWTNIDFATVIGDGSAAFYGSAFCFATNGSSLYVGGFFSQVDSNRCASIAQFDGSRWTGLGEGLGPIHSTVFAIAAGNNGRVAAGGMFSSADMVESRNVARWTGREWNALEPARSKGRPYSISQLKASVDGTTLYSIEVPFANRVIIRLWNGREWSVLTNLYQAHYQVPPVVESGNPGLFLANARSPLISESIQKWTPAEGWQSLGYTTGNVNCLLLDAKQELFAGGAFQGRNPNDPLPSTESYPTNIARWDGSRWQPLGKGVDSEVTAMASAGDQLLVGGDFTHAGDISASHVARWNGADWFPLGKGIAGTNVRIRAISSAGGLVYVAGSFSWAGGKPARNIACWDGNDWTGLDSGTDGEIVSLAFYRGHLFACGRFNFAGGVPAAGLAEWDGAAWQQVPISFSRFFGQPAIQTMAEFQGALYFGGAFDAVDARPCFQIARWLPTPSIRLDGPTTGNRTREFQVSGLLGLEYEVQVSDNLMEWTPGWRGGIATEDRIVIDGFPIASNPQFFRISVVR